MRLLTDFKTFALKGNVLDLAIGIIIGAAFGRIVSSLVADIIMPPLGLLMGGINFTDFKFVLRAAANGKEAVSINYGVFVQHLFDFLIVALAIFMVVRLITKLRSRQAKAPEAAAPVVLTNEEKLLTEIRDLLKSKQ